MPSKPSNVRASRSPQDATERDTMISSKAIHADAFDRFIEEQLKRERAATNQSSNEVVVCHVY
jgi:hypothetical protein